MSAPTALADAKAALVAACRTLWTDPVVVFYGPCGTDEPDDYAEVLDLAWDEDEARMSPQRRRWHMFTIEGRVSCYRGGGIEAQQVATEAALTMVGQLADYVQDSGTTPSTQTNLGGTVQWVRLTAGELTEEPDDIERGRTATVAWTISGSLLA